ncbi:hypothetical protein PQR52_06760 [Paraburkholderia aspalathi]|uniref:hypothetical protein n=1 Tax=Paraburkholderia aspalathi TaxID=1324617 RepID=UPI0038BC555A
MANNNPPKLKRDDPMWDVALAIENSVRAIRKAGGKENLEECTLGTPEHEQVLNEFLEDVLGAIGGEEAEAGNFGAGAAGYLPLPLAGYGAAMPFACAIRALQPSHPWIK